MFVKVYFKGFSIQHRDPSLVKIEAENKQSLIDRVAMYYMDHQINNESDKFRRLVIVDFQGNEWVAFLKEVIDRANELVALDDELFDLQEKVKGSLLQLPFVAREEFKHLLTDSQKQLNETAKDLYQRALMDRTKRSSEIVGIFKQIEGKAKCLAMEDQEEDYNV